MGPQDAERGREGRCTAPWVNRVPCGGVARVVAAALRGRLGQRDAVNGARESTSFTQRLGAVAAAPDAAATAVPRG
jgi:hypothetical protein